MLYGKIPAVGLSKKAMAQRGVGPVQVQPWLWCEEQRGQEVSMLMEDTKCILSDVYVVHGRQYLKESRSSICNTTCYICYGSVVSGP